MLQAEAAFGEARKTVSPCRDEFLNGSTRRPEFMAKNPNGKVPLMELEDGRLLAESNAILLYLAEGTRFLPGESYRRGLVYQWLFFEQYSHEPYVAVRRALLKYPERAKEATPERLASTLAGGKKALAVMEDQLGRTSFLAGDTISVADIALLPTRTMQASMGLKWPVTRRLPPGSSGSEPKQGHVPIEWVPNS